MNIYPKSGGAMRPAAITTPQPVGKAEKTVVAPVAAVSSAVARGDKVQISDAGRALAARDESGALSAERSAQIRQRVLDGAYNSLGVVDEVARRIIQSGDL